MGLQNILNDLNIKTEKRILKKLSTGITTRQYDSGGEIKVTTDSDKNFAPYLRCFISIEQHNQLNELK